MGQLDNHIAETFKQVEPQIILDYFCNKTTASY
jgi:hypothetical protein